MILGVDLALRYDRTVLAWLNDDWQLCRIDVLVPPLETKDILKALNREIPKVRAAYCDAGGIGDVLVSILRERHPNVHGVKTVGGRNAAFVDPFWMVGKQLLIGGLEQALTRKKLTVTATGPGRAMLLDELQRFRRQQHRGHVELSAPAGQHDDCVSATALAVFGKLVRRKSA